MKDVGSCRCHHRCLGSRKAPKVTVAVGHKGAPGAGGGDGGGGGGGAGAGAGLSAEGAKIAEGAELPAEVADSSSLE